MSEPFAGAADPNEPDLQLRGVTKRFGEHTALDGINLTVDRGEFVAIMGPSGCGKTTLLRIIAGLETMDQGSIRLRGKAVENVPVHKRNIRLVWQNYALFPHLNVRRNIEFGLTFQKLDKATIRSKVAAIAEMVQLGDLLDRRVTRLSGGQRQRVAIARALVTEPDILLLDEPLSALDAHLRVRVQGEMKRLQRRLGISFVYITHNQSEALSMADRVVVINKGNIEQIDTPQQVYLKPKTRFVAEFVGTNNIFEGKIADIDGELALVDGPAGRMAARLSTIDRSASARLGRGSTVLLVVQAGKVRMTSQGSMHENHVRAAIAEREFSGSHVVYFLRLPEGSEIKMILPEPFDEPAAGAETALDLYWSPDDVSVIGPGVLPGPANVPGGRTYVRPGSPNDG